MLRNIFSRLFRERKKNEHLEEFKDAELERGELESKTGAELYREIWSGNYTRNILAEIEGGKEENLGYVSIPLFLLSYGYPENKEYAGIYRTLTQDNSPNTLCRRLEIAGQGISTLNPSKDLEDIAFMEELKKVVRYSAKSGDLAEEVQERCGGKVVDGAIKSIDYYLTQCDLLRVGKGS